MDLCWQCNVCAFNMLSRLVITFLPRNKRLLISCLQSSSAVILEPPKIKPDTVSTVSPSISHEVMGSDAMILVFWMLSFQPTFPLSSFTFIKRPFSLSSLSAIRVVSSAYLRLLIFLPAIFIPAGASSSSAFLMMDAAYMLNKQGDNIQPWRIPFPFWNQSVVPCPVLTVASWPAYRFLKRQVSWSGIPISFRIFHSLLWCRKGENNIKLVSFLLMLKRVIKIVWHLQPISSIWRPLPFLPATLSVITSDLFPINTHTNIPEALWHFNLNDNISLSPYSLLSPLSLFPPHLSPAKGLVRVREG